MYIRFPVGHRFDVAQTALQLAALNSEQDLYPAAPTLKFFGLNVWQKPFNKRDGKQNAGGPRGAPAFASLFCCHLRCWRGHGDCTLVFSHVLLDTIKEWRRQIALTSIR